MSPRSAASSQAQREGPEPAHSPISARDLSRLYLRALGVTIVLSTASALLARHLLVNGTASMPLGLYWLSLGTPAGRGDLVAFAVPENVRSLVRERRYLPDGSLLLKRVVAAAGDRVCTRGGVLTIDGASFGPIASRDSAGRPLPHAELCGPLAAGQLYVASHAAQSFDSRAFGPVHASDVRGTVTPLWTL